MKGQIRLLSQYPELDYLLPGCPNDTEIIENTYLKTPEAFAKQRESVARRRSHASVVGIMLLEQERIALVHRTGSNAGLALPSGSVKTEEHESLLDALAREMREELAVVPEPDSVHIQDLEIRTFVMDGRPERQHVFVATFVGHIAAGQEVQQTEAATLEGVRVGTYPLNNLPPLVFNDTQKVLHALPQFAPISL